MIGVVFRTTARVIAAYFSAVGMLLLLVLSFTLRQANAARLSAVGVGVMPPILLLLVATFTQRLG